MFKGKSLGYQTTSIAVIHAKKKNLVETLNFFKDLRRNSYNLVNFVTFELINLNVGEVN